jgi:hypothetical protein
MITAGLQARLWWQAALNTLRQNKWFKTGIKVAIAIGNDADIDMLAQFTGSREGVLTVHTAAMLKKMIQFVAVRSSQIGSKSTNVPAAGAAPAQAAGIPASAGAANAAINGDTQKQQEMNSAMQEMAGEIAAAPDNSGEGEW